MLRRINGYVITLHKSQEYKGDYKISMWSGEGGHDFIRDLFDGLNYGRAVEILKSKKLGAYIKNKF